MIDIPKVLYFFTLQFLFSSLLFADQLSGTISNAVDTKAPVNAIIWLESSGYADTTDANGQFFISGIPKGYYTVIIQAENYVQRVITNVLIDDDVNTVGIKTDNQSTPSEFRLMQNYPNPFNPTTTISYNLPQAGHVSIKIYDQAGRYLDTPVDQWQLAGTYNFIWNGTNRQGQLMPSGVYYYQIKTGKFTQSLKMTLIK